MAHFGLTATALADSIEVQRSSISHLLSGRNKPSLDFVLKILQKYPEVELYWLLNGKGSFPDKNETKKTPSLFSNKTTPQKFEKEITKKEEIIEEKEEIEKIVIFYKNGTFKSYTP
jgi:plasmid maintenance system antidote protein VapI